MTGAVNTYGIPEEILMKNPEFASRVVKNVLPDTSIAIRFERVIVGFIAAAIFT